jgi:hypothetical protein
MSLPVLHFRQSPAAHVRNGEDVILIVSDRLSGMGRWTAYPAMSSQR